MKLIGYIHPFINYSFTIPIYSESNVFYFHKINYNYKIEEFIQYDITDYEFIEISEYINFNIGEFCAIVYITSNYDAVIESADKIYDKLLELDDLNIFEEKYKCILDELEEIKKNIN
jgi:hypothetical protein